MKIPSHSHRTAPSRDRSTPSKAEKAEKSGAGAGRPAAKVQVSGGARALEGLRAPEQVDSAKVARLRQAIDNGEFEVDADRIAERMLEEERE
ncbi:MAG: flagellar biosynthesis anti-sigma factor FlgM [Myxococcales bacterium]|nr:flagellar biosynthesis anti-sigma factor FlgM [Myxococcales bacterium]